jgi:hypothetical protein
MNEYSPLISEFGSMEEEAAYNDWFHRKVEASLSDARPPVAHDVVMARIDAIIERARKCQREG